MSKTLLLAVTPEALREGLNSPEEFVNALALVVNSGGIHEDASRLKANLGVACHILNTNLGILQRVYKGLPEDSPERKDVQQLGQASHRLIGVLDQHVSHLARIVEPFVADDPLAEESAVLPVNVVPGSGETPEQPSAA